MKFRELPARAAEAVVHLWRIVPGRLLPPMCRFRPSCSEYMLRALRRHGLLRGGRLGLARLLRCHPWSRGGLDPVPGEEAESRAAYEAELLRQFPDRRQDAQAGAPPSGGQAKIGDDRAG